MNQQSNGQQSNGQQSNGGAAAGAGNQGAPASSSGTQTPWYGEIPADRAELREWVANKAFADPITALESAYNLEKLIGAPPEQILRLPKPDDAEGWAKVWERLGRPAKPEEYELPVPTGPDGKPSEADAKFAQFVAGVFHQAGVPKAAAVTIAKAVNEYAAQQREAYVRELEAKANRELEELKAEWGASFSEREEWARRGLRAYGQKAGLTGDDLNALESAIGTAKMLRLFVALGETTSEHDIGGEGAGSGSGGSGMTPQQAKARLDELRQQRIEGKISQDDYLKEAERLAPLAERAA